MFDIDNLIWFDLSKHILPTNRVRGGGIREEEKKGRGKEFFLKKGRMEGGKEKKGKEKSTNGTRKRSRKKGK